MIKTYVPESLIFRGKEYQGEQFNDVPDELAELIANHPQWSKAVPPKPVDPYRQLKNQKLSYLKNELASFEADLAQRKQQIETYLIMDSVPPKSLIVKQENVQRDYENFKAYVLPLIERKQAEETARRAKVAAIGAARGAVVTFDSEGNWSEHYITVKTPIGGKL